jgi:hypothetical protein
MLRWSKGPELRWLDFDIENRPLSYAGDWTTAEVTAIAAGWADEKKVRCWALGEVEGPEMLERFFELYDQADGVTGHYIRKHDLPILNGALMEVGLPTLGRKLTSDTCLDLIRRKDISRSQAALADLYGVEAPKVGMSQKDWRAANRLTPEGIAGTKGRVIGDVHQHKALRVALHRAGALGAPRVWYP